MLSQLIKELWNSFMLLNKHGKTVVSVINSWLKDFDEKILENLGENWWMYQCSKQSVLKSCLTQSLNSVFQLNFDHFFHCLYMHVYNFTPTRNLTSFKDLQRWALTETYTRESPFFYSVTRVTCYREVKEISWTSLGNPSTEQLR